jgi:O-antigen/teichoic acid export membrane protein
MFRDPHSIKKLRLWLSLSFAGICGADFLASGSTTALFGVVAGLVGAIYILAKRADLSEEALQRRRPQHWTATAALIGVLVLLIVLGAPGQALLAFAGLLLLIALVGALRSQMTYRRQ